MEIISFIQNTLFLPSMTLTMHYSLFLVKKIIAEYQVVFFFSEQSIMLLYKKRLNLSTLQSTELFQFKSINS